ncbi:MAG: AMP-binding protein [Deltaproteobacteria bacterium]|nr:AMP-binding protein [Deltaproteobacteria bacterium]
MADERFWVRSYDPHVPRTFEFPRKGLGELFAEALSAFPDRPACWMMEREIRFSELDVLARRFAAWLGRNGLAKGDVVAISLPNCPQYLIAHIGTILAGGVSCGCSPLLSAPEVAYQLNDSGAKFLVTLDAIYEKVLGRIRGDVPRLAGVVTTNVSDYMGLPGLKVWLGKKLGKIPHGRVDPWPGKLIVDLAETLKTPETTKRVEADPERDVALLYYTGGTTGHPKGAELTHANVVANLHQAIAWMGWKPAGEVGLSAFPLFHLAGMMVCNASLALSSTQILIANPRDTGRILLELTRRRPTWLANVPSLYQMLLRDPGLPKVPADVLDGVRAYISGAAPLPSETFRRMETALRAEGKIIELYGMTEASPVITANPLLGKKKLGSIGLPLTGTDLRIESLETGEPVAAGQPGEIVCRGPQVMRGYRGKPEETASTLRGGWLHTGDVAVMDEDGYLTIVDRIKDMIIVGGFKVFSTHVEEILARHPKVELAATIGVPDPDRPGSEMVRAVVQLRAADPADEAVRAQVRAYAKENLSRYEYPRQWDFRAALPLTPVGKVSKLALRQELR